MNTCALGPTTLTKSLDQKIYDAVEKCIYLINDNLQRQSVGETISTITLDIPRRFKRHKDYRFLFEPIVQEIIAEAYKTAGWTNAYFAARTDTWGYGIFTWKYTVTFFQLSA
jgi:hypothetical protein